MTDVNAKKVLLIDESGQPIVPLVDVAGGDSLPDQAGNSGKFLTTNGTEASWATIEVGDALPTQTGQSGKYLTTNGSSASWNSVTPAGIGAVATSSLVEVKVVTTTNSLTGTPIATGYRTWSDGWVEQFGQVTSSANPRTVTLPIAYNNTDYNVQVTGYYSTHGTTGYGLYISSVSGTGFSVSGPANPTMLYYYTCGYKS